MNKEDKYYVYGHYLEDGTLFYIGKGCGNRHSAKAGRRNNWVNFVANKSWYSVILFNNLSNDVALSKERELISQYKSTLINVKTGDIEIDLEALKSSLKYDETSSTFLRWIKDIGSGRKGTTFKIRAGDEAGHIRKTGYLSITCRVKNTMYVASRVIWYLVHGVYPTSEQVVDHVDGNSLNNNIVNLRLCSQAINSKNSQKRFDNKTGQVGVYFANEGGRDYCKSSYTLNGIVKVKTYSINKYGEQEAFRLARDWRKEQIRLLNEQGAGYTDRHGT